MADEKIETTTETVEDNGGEKEVTTTETEEKVEDKGGEKTTTAEEEKDDDFFFEEEKEDKDKNKDDKDNEEDEVSPEDEKLVRKLVEKELAPFKSNIESQKREAELQAFIGTPQGKVFEPYAAKIRELANKPQLKGLKISAIAAIAGAKDLMRLGAEQAEKAKQEAAASATGGNSQRKTEGDGEKSAWDMTKEEFEATKLKVMQSQ